MCMCAILINGINYNMITVFPYRMKQLNRSLMNCEKRGTELLKRDWVKQFHSDVSSSSNAASTNRVYRRSDSAPAFSTLRHQLQCERRPSRTEMVRLTRKRLSHALMKNTIASSYISCCLTFVHSSNIIIFAGFICVFLSFIFVPM
jgi:hypothetical protein